MSSQSQLSLKEVIGRCLHLTGGINEYANSFEEGINSHYENVTLSQKNKRRGDFFQHKKKEKRPSVGLHIP